MKTNNKKVLIADDDPDFLTFMEVNTKLMGFEVHAVTSQKEAEEQLILFKPDLAIFDLQMPEMDGFESAQRINKFDKTVLIVAFTADNMPETRRKAELSGIKDFISKPVRIDELKRLFAKYFKK